ncbi:hypothetical protein [Enterobacter kobei]|uniref:hypothetical protein n=1 Tax=Enterobacter kobei TaxID=208224 RepID=UPI00403F0A7E
MRRNVQKQTLETNDIAFRALSYAQQVRGIVCAELDLREEEEENEQRWRFDALLTLACLLCDELEKAAKTPVSREVKA